MIKQKLPFTHEELGKLAEAHARKAQGKAGIARAYRRLRNAEQDLMDAHQLLQDLGETPITMNPTQEKKILHQRMGPGGPHCPCCRHPSSGNPVKHKRRFTRMVKRHLRHLLRRSLARHETP